MHLDNIDEKLKSIKNDAQHMIARNVELQAENKKLEGSLRIQRHLKDEYKQIAHEAIAQVQGLGEPKEVEDIAHTLNSIAQYLRVADESVLKQYSIASDGDSSTEELVLTNGMTVTIERESNYKEDTDNGNKIIKR